MNGASVLSDIAPGDRLTGAHGTLVVSASGTLSALVRDATGVVRAAAAGDGFAADIADAVRAGDASSMSVSSGRLVVVLSAGAAESHSGEPVQSSVAGSVRSGAGAGARAGARERAIAVDMTNWSVAVESDNADLIDVVKVVGSWGGADRAARQLTRIEKRGAGIIPPFIGRLDWEHPERGTSTIALVSCLIAGAEDGWTWAVDDVLAFAAGGPEPGWPARVGTLAAEMHRALLAFADAAAPPPAGTALRARAEATLDEALRVTDGPAGVRLRNRAAALRAVIAGIPDHSPARVFDLHGDFHVGQVLRSPAASGGLTEHDYWVVDFDGDPQLDDVDRDRADFSARDVAHMLTSIDLVGAVAMRRLGSALPLVRGWAARARVQLLTAYRDALAASSVAATSIGDSLDERLLEGFIVEQLLRELIYAHRYLQRWQYAPDAVITFSYPLTPGLDAGMLTEEEPWTPPVFTTT